MYHSYPVVFYYDSPDGRSYKNLIAYDIVLCVDFKKQSHIITAFLSPLKICLIKAQL